MKIDLINLIDLISKKFGSWLLQFRNYLGQLDQLKIRNSRKGFTLIEALVAASVFVFVISAIMGVYLSALRLDTRTRAQRALTDNSRFIMEFLSKEIRNGHFDYTAAACGGVVTSTTDLCLINQDDESEHLYAADVNNLNNGTGTDLVIAKSAGQSNLNSSSVKITKLKFFVAPANDPLTPTSRGNGYNEQPHVTVIMEIKSKSTKDPVKISLQSTFSEDYYPSRLVNGSSVLLVRNIVWNVPLGGTITVNGNSLTKTSGGDSWSNAMAHSSQVIPVGDGYVEFTAAETNTYRILGLSDSSKAYNTTNDIDYGIVLTPGTPGGISIVENGSTKAVSSFTNPTLMRIAVESGQVKYYGGGNLIYTSTIPPTTSLIVNASLYSNSGGNNATINNAQVAY